jgi:hypothetical protein
MEGSGNKAKVKIWISMRLLMSKGDFEGFHYENESTHLNAVEPDVSRQKNYKRIVGKVCNY